MKFHNTKVTIVDRGGPDALAIALSPSKDEILIAREDKTFSVYTDDGKTSVNAKCLALSLDWCPQLGRSSKIAGADIIAAACTDGTLRLLKKSGSVTEKKVKAHDGAAICAKWSSDGLSIATAGEDGQVKVWSKTGNLRTKLASYNSPIHDIAWNATSDAIAVAYKNTACVHNTQKKKDIIRWECHSANKGVVLCIDWSPNGLIVCGGEDRCYRIFDSHGILLFESATQLEVITSLSWSPCGSHFLVGSLGSMALSSKSGHLMHREFFGIGSATQLKWGLCGTQIFGICGFGSLISADVVGKKKEWNGFTVEQTELSKIVISRFGSCIEEIELSNHLIEFEIGCERLAICTATKCYVYDLDTKLGNSIAVIDLNNTTPSIILSDSNFALVSFSRTMVYSYDGNHISTLSLQNVAVDISDNISLSGDMIAVVDQVDRTIIHLYEVSTGKRPRESPSEIKHDAKVERVILSHERSIFQERSLLIVDEKKDLFVCSIGQKRAAPLKRKIGSHTSSVVWHEDCNFVAAISDARITIWYMPNAIFVDKHIFDLAIETRDVSDLKDNATISSFRNSEISIIKNDGTKLIIPASGLEIIHEYARAGKWEEAVRLCRFIESSKAWAMLTVLSIMSLNFDVAETGLCACRLVDKVEHLRLIKSMKNEGQRNAELHRFMRRHPW